MIFILLLALFPLAYLAIEERERRAANPSGPSWRARMRQSAKGKIFWLYLAAGSCITQTMREKDWQEIVFAAALMICGGLFMTAHDAARLLPHAPETCDRA